MTSTLVGQQLKTSYIELNSKDRDFSIYKFSNQYRFTTSQITSNQSFGRLTRLTDCNFRQVVSIKLIQATIPNIISDNTTVYDQPKIYVKLDEINGANIIDFTNPYFNDVVAVICPNMDKTKNYSSINVNSDNIFPPKKLSFSKFNYTNFSNFTVSLIDQNSNLFNFGNDTINILTSTPSGTITVITTSGNHGLITGDFIYIKDHELKVIPSGEYTVLNEINNSKTGFYITNISPTTFSINFDSNGFDGGINGFLINVKKQNSLIFEIEYLS